MTALLAWVNSLDIGTVYLLLGVVAVLVAVPVLIWAACRVSIVFPVIAVDRVTGPVAAIRRAWGLTGGHVLKIIALFVIYAVAAAILTPPDVISQLGLAIPTILLYEGSILAVKFVERRRAREEAARQAAEAA